MGKASGSEVIRIRGARQNNLKGFDLDLPTRRLVVVTGLSGSGKSSLAFDTLYAEGQRRYIETFSPYARQFFDRMDRPRVDAIEGIPPAIALEQRNSVRTTRSTVGTMTEICDHLKVLWPHLARLHCRCCGRVVTQETPRDIWERFQSTDPNPGKTGTAPREVLVSFRLPLSDKLGLEDQLDLVGKQGFRRLWLDGEVLPLEEARPRLAAAPPNPPALVVVQDRIRLDPSRRARFVEACEQAYHFGHGKLTVYESAGAARWDRPHPFSRHLHCASCDLEYREPTPALFSFNHPIGACPACKGFGRIIAIDYDLAIPDRAKSLAEGAIKPWQSGMSAECQSDLVRAARREGVPLDVPFRDLPAHQQRWVIDGDPDYGEQNQWPSAWYGVKGYFRWLESKAYKMHVRVLLSRYRAYTTCPTCEGRRLQPDALLWRLPIDRPLAPATGQSADSSTSAAPPAPSSSSPSNSTPSAPPTSLTLADFYALPIRDTLPLVESWIARRPRAANDPLGIALAEIRSRLRFLDEVGVGYLTLDRPTRTLSGGETQRVNLTTCLGSRLVNTLFVLDEPSVGLHARDTERLVQVLLRLRDLGNTVVVVEHEAAVMRAADQIIDLGPGHGESGGYVVAQAPLDDLLRHPDSLTAAYLSGRRRIEIPPRRPVALPTVPDTSAMVLADQAVPYAPDPVRSRRGETPSSARARKNVTAPTLTRLAARPEPRGSGSPASPPCLFLRGVTRHNLRQLEVAIPLGRLVCLAGVSGSGKTTLAAELLRLLRDRLGGTPTAGSLEVREAENESETEAEEGESPGGDLASTGSSTRARLDGAEHLGAVLLVDQSPIGRTPRSNPAVYTGAFDHLRDLFAQVETARQRGLGASAFSFNSSQGQCEQCRGAGFEKVEMQFLSDVYIRCPACQGRRYRPHILEIKLAPPPDSPTGDDPSLSIADVLDLPVDDAIRLLDRRPEAAASRAAERLRVIQEVGLGYLRLGQPINTLSGGESQRLKLAGHLVESAAVPSRSAPGSSGTTAKPTLFLFDEPTTGLHFDDVRVLLLAFQRLVDAGHTVLIIEHHLEVLKCADWLIELGPEAGDQGGRLVVAGPPERVADCPESRTGAALRPVLVS